MKDQPPPSPVKLTPVDLRRASAGILDNTLKSMSAAVLSGGVELSWQGAHDAIDRAAALHDMSLRQKGATVTEND